MVISLRPMDENGSWDTGVKNADKAPRCHGASPPNPDWTPTSASLLQMTTRVPIYLGVTMMLFGALNCAIGFSLIGERGKRNRVWNHAPRALSCLCFHPLALLSIHGRNAWVKSLVPSHQRPMPKRKWIDSRCDVISAAHSFLFTCMWCMS